MARALDLGAKHADVGQGPDASHVRADDSHDGVALLSGNDAGYRLSFRPSQTQKAAQNRLHFDLTSSSLDA
ncbi:hypothetical protein HEP84_54330 [Streptomyces sp. RLB1-33]|uniref:hypothetical protein n=1 Tax=Streptomyces sp. RLB3-17 TaxID=2594455 RepID=UPI001CEC349E|nr:MULTISPECIES: hypothetical protein [unclassified Streptomyces]